MPLPTELETALDDWTPRTRRLETDAAEVATARPRSPRGAAGEAVDRAGRWQLVQRMVNQHFPQ